MEANNIKVLERSPASQKLRETDARVLLKSANKLIIAKGKKVTEFKLGERIPKEAVLAMLGPTGNLRAPTLRIGKNLVVGFNEEAYGSVFG